MSTSHSSGKPASSKRGQKRGESTEQQIIIRKYANRRLYDTHHSRYISLEDVRDFINREVSFKVVDAKTNEDLTRAVISQIIMESEARGDKSVLPLEVLMRLARVYGDQIERMFLPGYLDESLKWFSRHQQSMREQFENNMKNYSSLQGFQKMGEQSMKNMFELMGMAQQGAQQQAEAGKQDVAQPENESAKDESTKNESAKDESTKNESAKDESVEEKVRTLRREIQELEQKLKELDLSKKT